MRDIVEQGFLLEFLEETEVGSNFNEQLAMKKLALEIEERQKDREFELKRERMKTELEETQRDKELDEQRITLFKLLIGTSNDNSVKLTH